MGSRDAFLNRFSEMADVVVIRYRLGPDARIEFVSPSSLAILKPEEFSPANCGHTTNDSPPPLQSHPSK